MIIGIDRVHLLETNILRDILDFCSQNSIVFYLGFGSALGAYRHRGFIPWDEDIDILVPINYYASFIKGFKDLYKDKYQVKTHEDKDHRQFYGRISYKGHNVLAAYVDVNILVPLSNRLWKRNLQINRIYHLTRKRDFWIYVHTPSRRKWKTTLKRFIFSFYFIGGIRSLNKHFWRYANKYDYEQSTYVLSIGLHYKHEECFLKSIFGTPHLLEFEKMVVPVPCDINMYLTQLYNDYKTIPPKTVYEKKLSRKVDY